MTRLQFYRDSSLDAPAIIPHVLQSETGMPVARLMSLLDTADGIQVHIRRKGISADEDTLEPLARVYEKVPQMLERLLFCKAISRHLAGKVRSQLMLSNG